MLNAEYKVGPYYGAQPEIQKQENKLYTVF